MIQIEHLNKTYVSRQGETHIALTDINLTIEDGSVFGIIGQSGAGKSTSYAASICLSVLLLARSSSMGAISRVFPKRNCASSAAR